ncbi:hypothetical protein STEG23_010619, partial [Scotinomys teguina]
MKQEDFESEPVKFVVNSESERERKGGREKGALRTEDILHMLPHRFTAMLQLPLTSPLKSKTLGCK